MNLKSAVIICSLYFVTVTQSIGLNWDQLTYISEYNKNNISDEDIENLGIKIGLNMSGFVNEKGEPNARKLQDLLVFLASNDKTTDDLMKRYFLPFEVRLYIELFSEYDQTTNPRYPHKDILDFLRFKWARKPEGSGVDRFKIMELMDLRGYDPTIKDKHLNPDKVVQLFNGFLKVKDDFKGRFAVESTRNYFLELQELVIFTAEYSKYRSQGGPIYSTSIVRYVLTEFSKHDTDKDGLLNKDEVSTFILPHTSKIKWFFTITNIDRCMKKCDTNEDQHFDILELFMALFKARIDLSRYDDEKVDPRKFT